MGDDDNDFQIEDTENWRNPADNKFNHQVLIMKALTRIGETGSKELREGYWNEKTDKNGNTTREYHTDTRKEFIGSVKNLIMFMERDYDEEADTKILALQKKLIDKRNHWLNQEWLYWSSLAESMKKRLAAEGKAVSKGFFNPKLNFDNYYYDDETDIYREICSEINKLIKRLGDYEGVVYEG